MWMHPDPVGEKVLFREIGNPRLNALGLVGQKVSGCLWKRVEDAPTPPRLLLRVGGWDAVPVAGGL